VFDNVKTGNDIEIPPGESLDHIAMYRSHLDGIFCKTGVWLDTRHVERLACHAEKVAPGTSHFKKSSRSSVLADQFQTPSCVEKRQTLFFLESKISNVNVCSLDSIGNVRCSIAAVAKCQMRPALANVLEAAVAALNQRAIELR
jgi:hypothetical protein